MDNICADGKRLVDNNGRERIFSGINIVDKSIFSPGKQSFFDLDEEKIIRFASSGFNLIRLGFTWAKIEPEPGKYNDEYLDMIGDIIDICAKHGIYVFLDMHQDLFSYITNGDGAPKWAVLTDGIKSHPTRFVWAEDYFWGKACHKSFDNFWDNKEYNGIGLQDHFIDCWCHIIDKLGGKRNVIGYDIFNEPFPGTAGGKCFKKIISSVVKEILFGKEIKHGKMFLNIFSSSRLEKILNQISYKFLRKVTSSSDKIIADFDTKIYHPFMEKVSKKIREIDKEKLIFLENSYYSNLGIPYSCPEIKIDGKRMNNQIFSPHAYDFMVDTPSYKYASNDRVGGIFSEHKKSQDRLNVPVIVGEWGGFGSSDDEKWLLHIKYLLAVFDLNKWSNTYWQYSENFFNSPLMKVFIRPYPCAVSGKIKNYFYDYESKTFSLSFEQEKETDVNIISTPFEIKDFLLDGRETDYKKDGGFSEFVSEKGTHILTVKFN